MQPEDHQQFVEAHNPTKSPETSSDSTDSSSTKAYSADDENENLEAKYYFVLLAAQNEEEINGYTQSLLTYWNELILLLTLFKTKKAACNYFYTSSVIISKPTDTYILELVINAKKKLTKVEIDYIDIKSYVEESGYKVPTLLKNQQTKLVQHNDSLFINLIDRLNQKNPCEKAATLLALRKKCNNGLRWHWLRQKVWSVLQEDYGAFKILFAQPNRIIQALKPRQLLVLWKKYCTYLIVETEANDIDLIPHIHKSIFLASDNFAVEVYLLIEKEQQTDPILSRSVALEIKIIKEKLHSHSSKIKNSNINHMLAVDLLRSKGWREIVKKNLIRKYKHNTITYQTLTS